MAGGESHSYQVMLAPNQYLHVVVEQRDINVVVTLFGPDGNKLLEEDGEKRKHGTEVLTFIAEVQGDYRMEVRPAEMNAATGRYEAKIIALRMPTSDERALEQARRLSGESRGLRQQGKYDEAVAPAESALGIRERVLGPDNPRVADSLHFSL